MNKIPRTGAEKPSDFDCSASHTWLRWFSLLLFLAAALLVYFIIRWTVTPEPLPPDFIGAVDPVPVVGIKVSAVVLVVVTWLALARVAWRREN